jgi:DNA-binding NarL/FixJ family response regulator
MPNSIRVAICDDSPIVRNGLKSILNADTGIRVAFEASSPAEILKGSAGIELDIILADLAEQDYSEAQAEKNLLSELGKSHPLVKVIALNDCDNRRRLVELIELGVKGFQCKHHCTADEMTQAVHKVHGSGTHFSSCAMDAVLHNLQAKETRPNANLSKREQQVLDLVAQGKSNDDIGRNLFISTCTVKFHVSSILSKLNVKNRTEAALWLL